MSPFLSYLFEFTFISVIFYLIFRGIKNYSTPTFKRVYLLAWMLFSITFPLVTFDGFNYSLPDMQVPEVLVSQALPAAEEARDQEPLLVSESMKQGEIVVQSQASERSLDFALTDIVLAVYWMVAAFFVFRVVLGVFQVWLLVKSSNAAEFHGTIVYFVGKPGFTGASFFRWIFVGAELHEDHQRVILEHELTHKKLGHSADVLLSQLYQAIFWFHPFSWFVRSQVSQNAELEVDARLVGKESAVQYGKTLLQLHNLQNSFLMNNFSAGSLKQRMCELTQKTRQRRWVVPVTSLLLVCTFLAVSCSGLESDEVIILDEKLGEVKSITTRFTSHQSDTQQKTGKIVSIATFNPDGSLDDFVTKTSYPYDRDYEERKEFWDAPIKKNLFYIMDGLSIGQVERNLLYGNDWPKAYYKYYLKKIDAETSKRFPWQESVSVDDATRPTEITVLRTSTWENDKGAKILGQIPSVVLYYGYEGDKVVQTGTRPYYPEKPKMNFEGGPQTENDHTMRKHLASSSTYDGELLTSLKVFNKQWGDTEYRLYYENEVLIKQEYLKEGSLITTRLHYYKEGLKDRTEIYNRANEPEYTIHYSYEFW